MAKLHVNYRGKYRCRRSTKSDNLFTELTATTTSSTHHSRTNYLSIIELTQPALTFMDNRSCVDMRSCGAMPTDSAVSKNSFTEPYALGALTKFMPIESFSLSYSILVWLCKFPSRAIPMKKATTLSFLPILVVFLCPLKNAISLKHCRQHRGGAK